MKLSKIFALTASLLYLNSANATTACMPWPDGDFYNNSPRSNSRAPAYWNNFSYKQNGVTKTGAVVVMPGCSNQEPTDYKKYEFPEYLTTMSVASLDELPVSSSASLNKYCWCKMVYPFASKWLSGESFSSGSQCDQECGDSCNWDLSSTISLSSMFRMSIYLQNIDN